MKAKSRRSRSERKPPKSKRGQVTEVPKSARPAAKQQGAANSVRQSRELNRKNGQVSSGQWKCHLDTYDELRALQFSTADDFAEAAKRLWSPELRDLPFDLAGNRTVIVPQAAVDYFRGLTFTESDVLSPHDLTGEELADLRRRQGPY